MSLGAFWRKLTGYRQPPGNLIIDLHSDDEMDLGTALLHAGERLKASLGLDGANFVRVFSAITDYAMQEHKKGHALDNRMVPVCLSEDDWKAIFAFCLILKDQVKEKWPIRIIGRIAAETAKTYPKAGGPRAG